MAENAARPPARRLVARAAGWIERRNLAMADRVQTDSQYTLRVLQRKHPRQVGDKGRVVPGWVDFNRYADARASESGGAAPSPSDVPVFFTLRRLEARMGLETLVDASAFLRDRDLPFRVVIGGNGSLRESLERQVGARGLADRVQFIGRIAESDLPRHYAAADCFVLPTRALECFGLIVLEAFAAGTPVIASRAAAIPELADRQGPGWDFEPGDARGLAQRMEAFIKRKLQPSVDLPAIAAEFDRSRLFPQWHALLSGDCSLVSTGPLPNGNGSSQSLQPAGVNAAHQ
jgi:glycosyltransferase involved in cell wall biosynthesis